jgi:hypothetical protein
MKTKLTALALVAVTAFSLAPKPAKAGDKELAVVGGLIGGLIIGSAISDSRHSDHRNTTVIVDHRGGRHDRDRGFWKTISVKVWVPGCWVIERNRYGRDYRRYVDGHYTYRTDRVWVSYDRHDRHDHDDRYDRHDYGRGR